MNAVGAVVSAMETFEEDELLRERDCRFMHNLFCFDSENLIRAEKASAIRAVIPTMHMYTDNLGLQQQVCAVMYALASKHPEINFREEMKEIIGLVVQAMQRQVKTHAVLLLSCAALQASTSSNAEGNRRRARNAECFKAVVAAMCAHEGLDELQKNACGVLRNLTKSRRPCNPDKQTHRSRARVAHAIEAAVAAMRAHTGLEEVQVRACAALFSLTSSNFEQHHTRTVNVGAIQAVVEAMRAHFSSKELQECACGVLRNLTSSITGNMARAKDAGALEAVGWRCMDMSQNTRCRRVLHCKI